jgi:hypothetical protein
VTDKKTVRLGDRGDVEVKPIDLGTLKAIGMGSAKAKAGSALTDIVKGEELWYDGTYDVISAATAIPLEDLKKITGVTLDELLEASSVIFLATGLLKKKEEKTNRPGEIAGASAAATG